MFHRQLEKIGGIPRDRLTELVVGDIGGVLIKKRKLTARSGTRIREHHVCRTEFCAAVKREKRGGLYVFTYAGDGSVPPDRVNLRSQHATVVIDTTR